LSGKTAKKRTNRQLLQDPINLFTTLWATRTAELPPLTTALDILRLTSNACHAFRAQPEPEQRKLLTMMLKEAQWKDRRLHTTLREPFELLRRSNQVNSNGINGKGGARKAFDIWLPKNTVLQLFLSIFLDVSGVRHGFELMNTLDKSPVLPMSSLSTWEEGASQVSWGAHSPQK
jgi:hypothetical protein